MEESGVFFLASFRAAFVPELKAELINCVVNQQRRVDLSMRERENKRINSLIFVQLLSQCIIKYRNFYMIIIQACA